MADSWYEDFDEIDINSITHLYEMRHACNIYGPNSVAKGLDVSIDRIIKLYESNIHGSKKLKQFVKASNKNFLKEVQKCENENSERLKHIQKAREKNEQLIYDLQIKRKQFAGIGTNKAKRRLNKLAPNNPIAKATRIALETEDKSICAKNSYGTYQEKIYRKKNELILNLCELFKSQQWEYGVQKNEKPPTSHVIYFDIPGCEQISWHFTLNGKNNEFPFYRGSWDNKPNSTLEKLEAMTVSLLEFNGSESSTYK